VWTAPGLLSIVGVQSPLGDDVSVDISLAASWDGKLDWNDIVYEIQIWILWTLVQDANKKEIKTWHILYIGQMIRVVGEICHVDLQSQLRETAGFHLQAQQIVNRL
jgi:hypothetical protein